MENQTKNKYWLGLLGALLGAFVGALPLVLVYKFFETIYAVLATLIVAGSFYGYKLTKTKIDKKLPVIISICSLIAIIIAVFIAIPIFYLQNSGAEVSFTNLKLVYSISEIIQILITDCVIAIIFAAIIVGIIVFNLKKQFREGTKEEDIKIFARDASTKVYSKDDIVKVRQVFEKNSAIDKKHTITKDLIIEELSKEFGVTKGKSIFAYLKAERIIRRKSNKYYFSEKAENSPFHRYALTEVKTFVIIIIIAVALASVIVFSQTYQNSNLEEIFTDETRLANNIYELGIDNIILTMDDDMIILTEDEIGSYFGTQYQGVYDCVAANSGFEKMVLVVTCDKDSLDEDYTAEEFLASVLDDDSIEIKTVTINDHEYVYVQEPYTSSYNNKEYCTDTYILDAGDDFITIILDYPVSDELEFVDIVSKLNE